MKAQNNILLGLLLLAPEINCRFLKFCYFISWGIYWKTDNVRMNVDLIDPFMCTHLIWANVVLSLGQKDNITSISSWIDETDGPIIGRIERFNEFKEKNPGLKTILSISESEKLTELTKDPKSLAILCKNVLNYVKSHKFDGMEVHWVDHDPDKKFHAAKAFLELLRSLRQIFDKDGRGLLLIACMGHESVIFDNYDLKAIHPLVDYLMLQTYYYTPYDSKVSGLGSPLYSGIGANSTPSLSNTVNRYTQEGHVPPSKIVVGISLQFFRFALAEYHKYRPGSPVVTKQRNGKLYGFMNTVAYPEICLMAKLPGARTFWDDIHASPYIVSGDTFIAYENVDSIRKKIKWISAKDVAGVSVWAFSLDDRTGEFCDEGAFPLFTAIDEELTKYGKSEGDSTAKHVTPIVMSLCFLLSFVFRWVF